MAMSAQVSRAIAAFVADIGLGQDAARMLTDQYGDVTTVNDLPEWLTEDDDDDDDVSRAAGHDTTAGHDELHHYWTRGEGLAKWAGSPKPWTTLVALLTPHVGPAKAKVFASRWFIEVKGYAAGSDRNRVEHGHPPRGHRVGPG